MACQTQGIQQLLAAEKIAAEKVGEARKRKQNRVKQARDEAKEEIEKYRLLREQQYKEYEAKKMGSKEEMQAKIDIDTKKKIEEIIANVSDVKDTMIDELISLVIEVEPEVHRNYKYYYLMN